MSEPDPNPINSRMNLEKFVMYSAGIGMVTQLVGWAIGSRVLIDIGILGFLPLGFLYFAFFVGIIWVVLSQFWKWLYKAVFRCFVKRPAHRNDTEDQS